MRVYGEWHVCDRYVDWATMSVYVKVDLTACVMLVDRRDKVLYLQRKSDV